MSQNTRFQNVIVMGKSGAGKQPRIDVLTSEFGLKQLSTGNIFREYVGAFNSSGFDGDLSAFYDEESGSFAENEEIAKTLSAAGVKGDMDGIILGLKAKYFMNDGKFVPDEITNELFESFFSRDEYSGQVLDGYPRTPDQSKFLLDLSGRIGFKIDLMVLVDNEDELIVRRTMGRRICRDCGKVYHVEFKPSKDNEHCDVCSGDLILRSDDTEEKIRSRLGEFYDKAVPAMKVLEDAGIPLARVPGNLEVFTDENVRRSVMDAIGDHLK
ncbi:MAG: adenylate kinase family protein [Thermoplasmatota archaeon]